jgi:hypothetical protein
MSQIPNSNIQLTEEEIARRLNKFVVNDELASSLFNPDTPLGHRKQILQQMLDGAARHAITASNAVLEHRFGEHQKSFEDTDRIAREMYRDRMFDKFFGKYGTLKDYRKLVEDSVAALSSREDLPTDDDKLFEMIANEATSRVKPLKPDFVLVPDDKSGAPAGGGSQSAGASAPHPTHTPASTDAGGYQGGTAGGSRQSSVPAGRAEPGLWDEN